MSASDTPALTESTSAHENSLSRSPFVPILLGQWSNCRKWDLELRLDSYHVQPLTIYLEPNYTC